MDVLLDLTPLDTTSRFRGIGYYVSSIASGIDALTASERQGLDIRGLIGLSGRAVVGPLSWKGTAGGVPYHEGTGRKFLWERRSSLVKTLWRERPRLLHLTQNLGTPRGAPIPRVITCHDLILLALHREYLTRSEIYRRIYTAVEWSRFRLARRIIAISQYTADDLMRILGIPASQIDVIPHGVHHDTFRPPRDEAEAQDWAAKRKALNVGHKPYILFLGSTDPRKGAEALIRAFGAAKLDDVELVFAGRLEPDQLAMLNRERGAHVDPYSWSVRSIGFVPDSSLPALLDGALALAYPSRYEGFGLPVIEAMATGCPVITTSATSLAEVAGDAALMVKPDDIEGLMRAIKRVATEPSLRSELRQAGIQRASQFSWRRAALATVDTYARALRDLPSR